MIYKQYKDMKKKESSFKYKFFILISEITIIYD